MKFDLWKVQAEKRITDLEISNAERDRQYNHILVAMTRIETKQESYREARQEWQRKQENETQVYREQVANTLDRQSDILLKILEK